MAHVLQMFVKQEHDVCEEAVSLANSLGLKAQAKRYSKSSVETSFTPMSWDERLVWGEFCPTIYSDAQDASKRLAEYAFDTIPIEVMRHWSEIKKNYAFDSFGIWTTEKTKNKDPLLVDPLLVGSHGMDLYLLARWGLESPGSLPIKEVAEKVKKMREKAWSHHGNTSVFSIFSSKEKRHESWEDSVRRLLSKHDNIYQAACRISP